MRSSRRVFLEESQALAEPPAAELALRLARIWNRGLSHPMRAADSGRASSSPNAWLLKPDRGY